LMTSTDRVFVWSGGIVFVGSLALCAYSYVVRWAVPHEVDVAASGFDAFIFTIFALHHSLFARTRAKDWLARLVPDRLLRSVYVWIASLLLVAVCVLWKPIGGIVYHHTGWIAVGHVVVQVLGVLIVAQSVRTID